MFDEKDLKVIQEAVQPLFESARRRCADDEEFEVVKKAFEFANDAHKNVRRRSGEPYILHPIAVARIVVDEIGLGYKSIAAALLHDVVEDTNYTVQDINSLFGEKISLLVDGLTKIKNVFDNQTEEDGIKDYYTDSSQAENIKRILLTLNDDVRVVLIKMADRLHNCRTIEFMPDYKRDKILSETMFIFIPLAHRLGLYAIKSELENIWLKYKEPQAYNNILEWIKGKKNEREEQMAVFVGKLKESLEGKFDFVIKTRVKTPYSTWRKMNNKHVSLEQIYDLFAVRIIFNEKKDTGQSEKDQCYQIFSIISDTYHSLPERMRDWVTHSKNNGYEALHCTLIDNNTGLTVEVQIRSKRMDDIAERGIAAHWMYKKEGYISEQNSSLANALEKLQNYLSNPADNINSQEFMENIHEDLVIGEIIVFTPKGAQKSIIKNSTALDFAYQVHTEIGNKAIAAKVNQKPVSLSHTLKTGDIIEVITAEDAEPKREYLKFLKTRTAKNRVIDWFRNDFANIRAEGESLCRTYFEQCGIEYTPKTVGRLSSRMGFNNSDEFLFRYGLNLITTEQIASTLKQIQETQANEAPRKLSRQERENLEINGVNQDYIFKIATCCNPIAGDPIIGFLTPEGSIMVHKKTCSTAESIAARHGDWIVMPRWNMNRHQSFLVRIKIAGIDRIGLLNEITRCISQILGVNIKSLSVGASEGIVDGRIDLFIASRQILEELIKMIKDIRGITNVERIDINNQQ